MVKISVWHSTQVIISPYNNITEYIPSDTDVKMGYYGLSNWAIKLFLNSPDIQKLINENLLSEIFLLSKDPFTIMAKKLDQCGWLDMRPGYTFVVRFNRIEDAVFWKLKTS